jgi:molybdenum cofactor cytidylyltransferase
MTESSEPKIAGMLLAAGGSSRLGRPKQLVEFEGKTLIRRAVEALIGAGCSPVIIVLGADVERSQQEMDGLDVEIVVNESWQGGMGSSIACGMRSILEADAVLISLCDQPLVTAETLQPFLEAFRRSRPDVVTAHYDDISGVPALFSANLYPDLAALTGEKGAREIIRNSPDAVTIPLPVAAIDVDTLFDLDRLN